MAFVDKSKITDWAIDFKTEPEPERNDEYEAQYRPLLVELARAVSAATAANDLDRFYYLLFYCAQVFETCRGYLEKDAKESMR